MPRRPRIHYPGAVYHVTARGVEKRDIFLDSDDYRGFTNSQRAVIQALGGQLLAFCLMPNHVHLAIRVGHIALSRIMHKILFRHAFTFNAKYARVGHLFQGRHSAYLVTNETYLFNLFQYIHQNPVRAKLVARPRDWQWSSCGKDPREEEALPSDFDPYFGQTEEEAKSLVRKPATEFPNLDKLGVTIADKLRISNDELRSKVKRPAIMAAKRAFALESSARGFTTADIARWLRLTPRAVARYLENLPNVRAWP